MEAARAAVEREEADLSRERSELETARRVLEKAEQRLADARERVHANATDDLLFRSIQRELLEDAKLENVAIRAEVASGVVTLRGRVPSERLRERALRIARETPAVVDVKDRLEIAAAESRAVSDGPADD